MVWIADPQRECRWVETRAHSMMDELGFEHGLEDERERQGVHLQQAAAQTMQRRRSFPQQEKLAKDVERGVRFYRWRESVLGRYGKSRFEEESSIRCGHSTKCPLDPWEEQRAGRG